MTGCYEESAAMALATVTHALIRKAVVMEFHALDQTPDEATIERLTGELEPDMVAVARSDRMVLENGSEAYPAVTQINIHVKRFIYQNAGF